ncbi:hypothetical protein J2S43_002501 [Catenuloplanes nepalensis]|uniref:Uncharacterized protein n=1 Tax=Catenuloplanes nepalensis TaxID=587533 RepID=A0ABT9MRD1_9ACTN|nr:hypothetical protein [Catenuloplanes nepalensis]MDP9793989.1 hypothetical protein [Catenuloplanes nepalensis]
MTSLFGITWDVQWHDDVGPDTFFTLSHLMLYSGSAIAGVVALTMVLRATVAQRAGRPVDPKEGGRTVRVLAFDAPVGYLVVGTGAAMFLLYGTMDLWWHGVYGFDAILGSPPHMALFSSITTTMVGSIIVFGYAHAERWGRIGLALSLPSLMTFSPLMFEAFEDAPLPFKGNIIMNAAVCALCLVLAVGIVGRPVFAVVVAGALAAVHVVLWFWAPWAAHAYAELSGLPVRDGVGSEPPSLPARIPMLLLIVALLVAGVLSRVRRWAPPIAGAATGVVTAVMLDLQAPLINDGPMVPPGILIGDGLTGLLLGAAAGYVAWRFAAMVRGERREPNPIGRTAVGPTVLGGTA